MTSSATSQNALSVLAQAPMTAEEKLLVAFVLDRSGSMKKVQADVIGSHNTFLEHLRQHPFAHLIRFMRTIFSDRVRIGHRYPIRTAEELTEHNYVCDGNTAFFDALGATIEHIEAIIQAHPYYKRVIVAVMTDGEENASHTWQDRAKLAKLVEAKRAAGWIFQFYGTSEDAITEAQNVGFDPSQTQVWAHSAAGASVVHSTVEHTINLSTMGGGSSPNTHP
jgi:uncharacterized protein YegL